MKPFPETLRYFIHNFQNKGVNNGSLQFPVQSVEIINFTS